MLLAPHPHIGHVPPDLFAKERTDNDAEVLQSDLLRVEMELLREDLRDLDGDQNRSEKEDHGVSCCRYKHTEASSETQGSNKVERRQRGRVDASETEQAAVAR